MNKPTPEYLKLIEQFPLRRIKDRATNDAALKQLVALTHREDELSESEKVYFEVLSDLNRAYEQTVVQPIERMEPNAYLKHLMIEHNLRQVDVSLQTGISEQNLSSFLNGNRELSREEIERLAVRFSMSPIAFELSSHI